MDPRSEFCHQELEREAEREAELELERAALERERQQEAELEAESEGQMTPTNWELRLQMALGQAGFYQAWMTLGTSDSLIRDLDCEGNSKFTSGRNSANQENWVAIKYS